MERGNVYSKDVLPHAGRIYRERSAGGIESARTSSMAEQNRAANEQGKLLATFSQNGGESGFANFWREWAKALQALDPLVKGMSGTFERLTTVMQAPIRLFGMLGDLTTALATKFNTSEKNIVTFAGLGVLMATKWGRVAAVFTGLSLVLEDIAFGVMGKASYTQLAMMWLEDMIGIEYDTQAGILGWATALAASLYGVHKAMSMLKSVYDLLPDALKPNGGKPSKAPDAPNGKKPSKVKTLGKWGAIGATSFLAATTGGIKELPEGMQAVRVDDFASRSRVETLNQFANHYMQTTPEDIVARMITQTTTGNQNSSMNMQPGSVQINVTTNDPQKFSQDVKMILQSEFHDAMMANGQYGG